MPIANVQKAEKPLVMTLLVRNEADVVRQNLRFHLERGVDHVIAMDNGSTDGTTEILEEFADEGELSLLREPSPDYQQSRWVNRMVAMARDDLGAHWILNNDADEFWRPPDRSDGLPGDLKAELVETSAAAMICRRRNLVAPPDDLKTGHWSEKLIWRSQIPADPPVLDDPLRDRLRLPYFMYRMPPKVLVRADDLVKVEKGAHEAVFKRPVQPESGPIEILHLPIRSATEFQASVEHVADAISRDNAGSKQRSWKYRRWGRMFWKKKPAECILKEALPSKRLLRWLRLFGLVRRDVRLKADVSGQ